MPKEFFLRALGQGDPALLEELMADCDEVQFAAGQIIFHEHEECDQFFMILSGRVELEFDVLGRMIALEELGPGDELGWSSLLMREGKKFQARAVSPVHALAFDAAKLMDTCVKHPAFGFGLTRRLLEVVSRRLHATRLQLVEAYKEKARAEG